MRRFVPRSFAGRPVMTPVMTYALTGACCVVCLLGPASGFTSAYGSCDSLRHSQVAYFRQEGVLPEAVWSGALRPLLTPATALFRHQV